MMIDPPPPCFIFGRQCLVHSIVVVRLASSTLFQSARLTVSGVPAPMPTLLCRMSSRAVLLHGEAGHRFGGLGLGDVGGEHRGFAASSLICLASLSARSALRLTSTTLAPSRANRMAVAMPLPTPLAARRRARHNRHLALQTVRHGLPSSNAIPSLHLSGEPRAMTSHSETFDGGCTCRQVRYRMTSPLFVNCCHCRWCQRETGAAFALNAMIEGRSRRVAVRRT